MKKVFCLILALVICLGLCACGTDKTYVGKYKRTYSSGEHSLTTETLTIDSDNKYTYKGHSTSSVSNTHYDTKETGSWREVNGYIVFETISSVRIKYYDNQIIDETESDGIYDGVKLKSKNNKLYRYGIKLDWEKVS